MDLFGTPQRPKSTEATSISVGQLVRRARMTLEGQFGAVWVKGEISNLKRQSSGHIYFTLKDADAQLSCVMFRGNAQTLSARIADGVQVEAQGDLTVFEARGNMQLNVKKMQAAGQGALQAAFEALKAKLAAEGLFDSARKKPLPTFPQTIALVTSPSGAALQDMLNILQRRAPWLRILLMPVKVQGVGAAEEIAAAVRYLSKPVPGLPQIDLIVVGRGGGSIEDLWCFNEEIVARALSACPIPIISAVGHEIDFTISDFVADLRAPTPSAAAEILSPDGPELATRLDGLKESLEHRVQRTLNNRAELLRLLADGALHRVPERALADAAQRTDQVAEELQQAVQEHLSSLGTQLDYMALRLKAQRPDALLAQRQQRLDHLKARLDTSIRQAMQSHIERLQSHARLLRSLGPQAVLSRGYSLTTNSKGKPIRQAAEAKPGEILQIQFSDGQINTLVQ